MSKLKIFDVSEEAAREMLGRAEQAKVNTYPIANNGYAVSVLTAKGTIYEGVSYKSDTYTLTMHCEMTALANAAIHGERDIIAITGPNCHMCKQLIWESALNSGIDVQIIIEEEGVIRRVPISTLMTYPWPDAAGRH
ncbi:MAG TPA: cytidine deaminase [Candidatus Saccharimonadales bacterium]|nr:cytidine deaminase [Candidatus Saccharimonadales bacterium]